MNTHDIMSQAHKLREEHNRRVAAAVISGVRRAARRLAHLAGEAMTAVSRETEFQLREPTRRS